MWSSSRSARGPVGLMAFHGGLEGGTLEIAEAAAGGSGASLYTVAQPGRSALARAVEHRRPGRLTALAAWLAHVEVAIALHGYGRIAQPRRLLLGGTNRHLAGRARRRLLRPVAGFEW